MITVSAIPAFADNYLWLLASGRRAAVVDPGDAAAVQAALDAQGLQLAAILVTHHHPDHVGGIARLTATTPVPVFGPRAELAKVPVIDHPLDDGDVVDLGAHGLPLRLRVLAVPGHTAGHIAYHAEAEQRLFCGDTLFVSGCGRLFEGTAAQMQMSLSRFSELPGETAVHCAHEYTLSNMDFASAVLPGDAEFDAEFARIRDERAAGRATVPSSIARERALNPFLMVRDPRIKASVAAREPGIDVDDPVAVFAALRRWKDVYRGRSS